MMKPRVVETKFPTDDVVIASIVIDAPKDGVADATAAIQSAIDEAAAAGGAVVFLPAGKYRLAGRLTIKEGVTLRGDWAYPFPPKAPLSSGWSSILMPTADKGNADGPPAITMERGTGLTNLALWYPDQDPMKIVPYPWTIRTSEKATGDNITIDGIILVNPYQAIKIGPEWNELHTIRNAYGPPLKAGIWMDTTTDIGRLSGVFFRPEFWEQCGAGPPSTVAPPCDSKGSMRSASQWPPASSPARTTPSPRRPLLPRPCRSTRPGSWEPCAWRGRAH
ncbi:MAG: glycosyl hydrolase family 28-related protein [Planctomycetota bacterium]|nr:glycosyl hydrolase family 28-related protein [Planctomycetota bacterium]